MAGREGKIDQLHQWRQSLDSTMIGSEAALEVELWTNRNKRYVSVLMDSVSVLRGFWFCCAWVYFITLFWVDYGCFRVQVFGSAYAQSVMIASILTPESLLCGDG